MWDVGKFKYYAHSQPHFLAKIKIIDIYIYIFFTVHKFPYNPKEDMSSSVFIPLSDSDYFTKGTKKKIRLNCHLGRSFPERGVTCEMREKKK